MTDVQRQLFFSSVSILSTSEVSARVDDFHEGNAYSQTAQGRQSAIILISFFITQAALMAGILVLFDLQTVSECAM